MIRRDAAVGVVLGICVALAGRATYADVVHLSTGQSLTDVQVLSKNWKGYDIQLTPQLTIFFSRDEIESVERDNIEPGRAARSRRGATGETGAGAETQFHGEPVSPELSARLQELVNVSFRGDNISEIVRVLSEAYDVEVKLDPTLLEPGSMPDPTWTADFENAPFISVIQQLVADKGLKYRIDRETETIIIFGDSGPESPRPGSGSEGS